MIMFISMNVLLFLALCPAVVAVPELHQGFLYEFFDERTAQSNPALPDIIGKSWFDAEDFCSGQAGSYRTPVWKDATGTVLHGHLASVLSTEENAYLQDLYSRTQTAKNDTDSHTVWIGLHDELQEGSYRWTDKSPTVFYNWNSGEPNQNGNEDCVSVYAGGTYSGKSKWNDDGCQKALPFFCKHQGPSGSCEVSDWSQWSACDAECGVGTQVSTRSVVTRPSTDCVGAACNCGSLSKSRACVATDSAGAEVVCPTNCEMEKWGQWGKCSKPCGGGIQTRTRGFTSGNPAPECFKMDTVETRLCNEEECPCAPPETPCVMFFDSGGDDYQNFGKCPEELDLTGDTNVNRCAFRGATGVLEHSCCSSSFVRDVLFEQDDFKTFEAAVEAKVKSESCKQSIYSAICMMCSHDQHEFMRFNGVKWELNICQDTCVSLYESCKGEEIMDLLAIVTGSPVEDAEAVCQLIDALDREDFIINIGKHTLDEDCDAVQTGRGCFLFDSISPTVVAFTPKPGAVVSTDLRRLQMQFTEGIDLSDVAEIEQRGIVVSNLDTGAEVWSVNADENLLVLQSQTVWPRDTLVIELQAAGDSLCVLTEPSTTYTVSVPQGVFKDTAGNSFSGIQGSSNAWTFTTSDEGLCGGKGPNGNGKPHTIGAILATLCAVAVLGGGAFYVYRKKVLDPMRFAPVEGATVETEEGTHQIRLVPIYKGPDSNIGGEGGGGAAGGGGEAELTEI